VTSKFAKKSTLSDLNETWYDVRGRCDIHDDMTFKVIRGQGQGEEMTSVPIGTNFEGGSRHHLIFVWGVAYLDEGYLVVFVIVQNLVGIDT